MEKKDLLFYLLMFWAFSVNAQDNTRDAKYWITKGNKTLDLLEKGYCFGEAIKLEPENTEIPRSLRSEAFTKLGIQYSDSLPKLRGVLREKIKQRADSVFLIAYQDLKLLVNKRNEHKDHFLFAIVCVTRGVLTEAETYFKMAIDAKSNNPVYRIEHGIFLNGLNKPEKYTDALTDFEKAWNKKDNKEVQLYRLYYGRGVAYAHLGNYDKALLDFQEAFRLNPTYSPIQNALGNVYKAQKKEAEALTFFTKAIDLDPNYSEALFNRGVLYLGQEKWDEAKSDLDIAIEGDMLHDAYFYNRCLIFLAQKDYKSALKDVDRAIVLNPNIADYYYRKGVAHYYLKQYDEARKALQEAKSLDPKHGRTYYYSGLIRCRTAEIHHDKSEWVGAISDFRVAIEKDTALVDAYLERGFARLALSKPEALEDFNKTLTLNPKCAEAYYGRALANRAETPSVVLKDLEDALHYKKGYKEAYRLRAEVYLANRKCLEALKDVDISIRLQKDSFVLYHLRGDIYFCMNDYEKALKDYTLYSQKDTNNSQTLYQIALCYFKQKTPDYYRSIDILSKVLDIKPDFEEAQQAKKEVEQSLDNHKKETEKAIIIWETPANEYFRYEAKDSINPKERTLLLKGRIESLTEIKNIQIKMGNMLIKNRAIRLETVACCGQDFDADIFIPYADTTIVITVTVINQAGETSSERTIRVVKRNIGDTSKYANRKGRIAFVVGNGQYEKSDYILKNPVNDAKAIAEKLTELGFKVLTVKDADKKTLDREFDTFLDSLANYEVGLLYYAGHGVQYHKEPDAVFSGENYLLPTDAVLLPRELAADREADLKKYCISFPKWLNKMEKKGAAVNILILDACRNNPFIDHTMRGIGNRQVTANLAPQTEVPEGTCVLFSTEAGKGASDVHEHDDTHGRFAVELLKALKKGETLSSVFERTQKAVFNISNHQQKPCQYTTILTEYDFKF